MDYCGATSCPPGTEQTLIPTHALPTHDMGAIGKTSQGALLRSRLASGTSSTRPFTCCHGQKALNFCVPRPATLGSLGLGQAGFRMAKLAVQTSNPQSFTDRIPSMDLVLD
ncbi:hypothetical protein VTN02DRAFT_3346 [Thermoascus thermophilus]